MNKLKEIVDLQVLDSLLHKVEAEALEVVSRIMAMQKEVSEAMNSIETGGDHER